MEEDTGNGMVESGISQGIHLPPTSGAPST
jgi:hypothetical protein